MEPGLDRHGCGSSPRALRAGPRPGLAELGLVGLVVVPGIALLLANLEIVEPIPGGAVLRLVPRADGALVQASLIEANGSLASIHYQSGAIKGDTACYTCHSGYGLAGRHHGEASWARGTCGTSFAAATNTRSR